MNSGRTGAMALRQSWQTGRINAEVGRAEVTFSMYHPYHLMGKLQNARSRVLRNCCPCLLCYSEIPPVTIRRS